jgi:hypothetical protein
VTDVMDEMSGVGKALLVAGGVLIAVGALLMALGRLSDAGPLGWLGRLPGDILIKREHFTLYVPLATSVILSIVLSLVVWLLSRR